MLAAIPKQYLPLKGKTLLEITLRCFRNLPQIKRILVVTSANDAQFTTLNLPVLRCDGGQSRADSVLAGLEFLLEQGAAPDDYVLVHDAARPCLSRERLKTLIQTVLRENKGGLLACPVSDTLKQSDSLTSSSNLVQSIGTLDRSHIWQAHTPQMFRIGELKQALELAREQGQTVTDEASAMELMGVQPLLIADRRDNIKVTLPEDLPLAEFILQRHEELGL